MTSLNHSLFLWMNASQDPPLVLRFVALVLAYGVIWLVPLGLVVAWLWGDTRVRRACVLALATTGLALAAAQVITRVWPQPRPFMVPLGHTLVAHVADASFPSDHLTVLWSIAFSLLLLPRLRGAGALIALLALPVAWSRIYLGVHFPLDMLGAAGVAAVSAALCWSVRDSVLAPLMNAANGVYRRLFALPIRRGWVRG